MSRASIAIAGLVVAACALAGASGAQQRYDHSQGDRRGSVRGEMRAPAGRPYGGEMRQSGGRYYGGPPGYERGGPPQSSYPGFYPSPRRPNSLGADWRQQQEEARSGVRQGQMAPLGRVIEGIGRRSAGRPLDAGIEYQDGRAVYRVRWITPYGQRIDYIVDAATGTILSGR